MLSDTINQEQLEKDINFINNYPISILLELLPELGRSDIEELRFSDSEFEHYRLKKIADKVFVIFRERISSIVNRIDEYRRESKFNTLNDGMDLYRKIGIISGILIKICVGNLICYGGENNPFKELHEKYVEYV